ncbi:DUF2510 domain-containing protein [Nocardioides sp. Leaf285]|uniref:DUF2510 domain-containing protein n=1 Tax=Nocardioides sp. Leaf285 TaxID=1736322 RepID=UPI0007025102|nr:DUF2510 domain-containing protein [Nocardioides sp. Leaf285]KQP63071.1 hypothetical protein ASF47_18850 [Nocardioides sp. Leaf285]
MHPDPTPAGEPLDAGPRLPSPDAGPLSAPTAPLSPPAGWYPTAEGGHERYWDGATWSQARERGLRLDLTEAFSPVVADGPQPSPVTASPLQTQGQVSVVGSPRHAALPESSSPSPSPPSPSSSWNAQPTLGAPANGPDPGHRLIDATDAGAIDVDLAAGVETDVDAFDPFAVAFLPTDAERSRALDPYADLPTYATVPPIGRDSGRGSRSASTDDIVREALARDVGYTRRLGAGASPSWAAYLLALGGLGLVGLLLAADFLGGTSLLPVPVRPHATVLAWALAISGSLGLAWVDVRRAHEENQRVAPWLWLVPPLLVLVRCWCCRSLGLAVCTLGSLAMMVTWFAPLTWLDALVALVR